MSPIPQQLLQQLEIVIESISIRALVVVYVAWRELPSTTVYGEQRRLQRRESADTDIHNKKIRRDACEMKNKIKLEYEFDWNVGTEFIQITWSLRNG